MNWLIGCQLYVYIHERLYFYHLQLLSNYPQACEKHCAYFQSCKERNFSWLDREMVYISYSQGEYYALTCKSVLMSVPDFVLRLRYVQWCSKVGLTNTHLHNHDKIHKRDILELLLAYS